jgi:two-component system chemotaxis response regulator CheY
MSTRNLLKKFLVALGYSAFKMAENGQEALKILETTTPTVELVLCDWSMPEMTGIDLIKKIRASEKFCKIPFIMITSERSPLKVQEAITAGISNYIVKPFDQTGIEKKINTTFQGIEKNRKS